jgi:hypothetical protein
MILVTMLNLLALNDTKEKIMEQHECIKQLYKSLN